MRTTRTLLLGFSFLIAGFSQAGELGSFEYTLHGYPKGAAGCTETALAMGETFRSLTGASVKRASCENDREHGYDLKIVYEVETALPLVSSESKSGGAGSYASIAECEGDFAAQKNLFESRTGLKTFMAFCYFDESGIHKSIGTRFDALGTPKEIPQSFEGVIFAKPVSSAALEQELLASLKANDLTPAIVAVRYTDEISGWYRVVLKYFGTKPLPLKLSREEFNFNSPEECDQQLEALRPLLKAQGINPTASFCTWKPFGQKASINYIVPSNSPWFRVEVASNKFATLSSCFAAKDGIADYFKKTLKQPVIGAACATERGWLTSLGKRTYRTEVMLTCPSISSFQCQRPFTGGR